MSELAYLSIFSKLASIKQEHLLKNWDSLSEKDQVFFFNQISLIDPVTFVSQQKIVLHPSATNIKQFEPFDESPKMGNLQDKELGNTLIKEGKVGCIIVAGGEGSRLRFNGPKGAFPITKDGKSLFQFFAEKIINLGKAAKRKLKVAIMTSPANHQATLDFFSLHNNFGLEQDQLSFFSQGTLPFLDPTGNLFLEKTGKIAEGPDGNGGTLYHFMEQGIWERWKKEGIEIVNFVLVDNPLADPFDAEMIGSLQRQRSDIMIKCILRKNPEEKVGVLVKKGNQIEVVEYSEFPENEYKARNSEGFLKYPYANISLFSFTMDFVKTATDLYSQMPLHSAWKAVKYLHEDGTVKTSEVPNAWKFETFIFDLLPFASKISTLLYPREECFAPLKNATGPDSIIEVQKALDFMKKTNIS